MMGDVTIIDFLLARIGEDEEDASDAFYEGQTWVSEEESVVAADQDYDPVLFLDRKRDAHHAARWSPARVLAECEAKRRIVYRSMNGYPPAPDYERGWREGLERSLRDLAAVYADHPDYDEAWRP